MPPVGGGGVRDFSFSPCQYVLVADPRAVLARFVVCVSDEICLFGDFIYVPRIDLDNDPRPFLSAVIFLDRVEHLVPDLIRSLYGSAMGYDVIYFCLTASLFAYTVMGCRDILDGIHLRLVHLFPVSERIISR